MTCIITGCGLIEGPRYLWGDLHKIGDCFVFNGVAHDGKARWSPADELPPTFMSITVDLALPVKEYIERRGVAVFPEEYGILNDVAKAYLKNSPHAQGLVK